MIFKTWINSNLNFLGFQTIAFDLEMYCVWHFEKETNKMAPILAFWKTLDKIQISPQRQFFLPSSGISPCVRTDRTLMLPPALGAALLCSYRADSDMWLYPELITLSSPWRGNNYSCVVPSRDLNLGPKAFSLLEFEIAS